MGPEKGVSKVCGRFWAAFPQESLAASSSLRHHGSMPLRADFSLSPVHL